MAVNTWDNSDADNDGNNANNWSLGVFADTDVLTFDASETSNCTFTGAISCAGIDVQVGYTGTFNDGGQAFTVSGAVSIASGGAVTCTGTWTQDADADFTLTAATSWTIADWDLVLQGTGSLTNNTGAAYIQPHSITAASATKTTTVGGANNWRCDALTLGSGTLTLNKILLVGCTVADGLSFAVGHAITGAGSLLIYVGAGVTLSVPQINAAGHTGGLAIYSFSAVACGISLAGTINEGGYLRMYKNSAGATTLTTNDHDITAGGVVRYGNLNATNGFTMNLGASALDLNNNLENYNTGATTINAQTSTWTVAGDFDLGSNTTINAGTAQITFDGATAVTLTTAGETMPAIVVAKAANGVTLQDSLTCGNLTLTAGTFDMNGNALSCANFVDNDASAKTMDANVTVSGTGTYNEDITFSRLILTGSTTQTIQAGQTVTVSGYVAGDLNGSTFLSDNPTVSALLTITGGATVSNCTFTDIDASGGAIDADDGTNDSGGRNTNIDFVGTLGVTPATGPAGTAITISDTGNAFSPATGVTVGGVAAGAFVVVSKKVITCTVPPGTGTVDIVVQTTDGDYTLVGGYTYATATSINTQAPMRMGSLALNL
jgi:hypothetical protein